jgi:hypothetical protein
MSNFGMTTCPPFVVQTPPQAPAVTKFLPEKMELRVVEYTKTDSSGIERIVKVELQYSMHQFDEYGHIANQTPWESVERVKIELKGP